MVFLTQFAMMEDLPDRFGLVFDSWLDNCVHFVAIFATYHTDYQYHETLITFSLLLQKDILSAAQHPEYIKESLRVC